jgi:hypothetical protein
MHFGENQLSPRSVGISLLSTGPPPVLQHWWVRASTKCHLRFTLPMDSSRGFGSHRRYSRPLQTRFPSGSPALLLVNPQRRCTRRIILQKARHQPWPVLRQERPLAAGKDAVSGSLSSPFRGAFHHSLTVLVRYRSLKVFSLGGWSPQLPTRVLVPRGTQEQANNTLGCPYRTLTWSRGPFQTLRVPLGVAILPVLQPRLPRTRQTVWAAPVSLATTPGISVDVLSSGY